MKRKYGNRKTEFGGLVFDSAAEARRWAELTILERVGQITALRRQVAYELAPSVKFEGAARRKPALRLIVDFEYRVDGHLVLEDTKGVRTTAFEIKRHLLKSVHGLDIKMSGRARR